MTRKVVQVIEPKPLSQGEEVKVQKKRVCAYCRVSTGNEEQQSSYEAQVSYYEDYIRGKKDWELVDVYADEGISGTNTKHRLEFNRMIKDCIAGKIDMVVTKSISRFARNTEDCLKYVRQLKDKGIAVYFEKENINTLDSTGEVLLTILSSLAQDESRNISENVKWGIRRKFEDGVVRLCSSRFLGYDLIGNELVINEKEAEIVRRIFNEYLEGKGYQAIALGLMEDGVPTVANGKQWYYSTIRTILGNEKYCGTLLQQKTVTVDFLTHKRVKNKELAPMYKIEDNHEPIITKEVFEQVQKEREKRAKLADKNGNGDRTKHSNLYAFSGKLVCKKCGNTLKRRKWNCGTKSEKVVWQCKSYINHGKDACDAKAVSDEDLKRSFVKLVNDLRTDKEDFLAIFIKNTEKILERNSEINLEEMDNNIREIQKELRELVRLQIKGKINEDIYEEEYILLNDQLEGYLLEREEMESVYEEAQDYKARIIKIVEVLTQNDTIISEFDDEIFKAMIEKVEIVSPTHFRFKLNNGAIWEDEYVPTQQTAHVECVALIELK